MNTEHINCRIAIPAGMRLSGALAEGDDAMYSVLVIAIITGLRAMQYRDQCFEYMVLVIVLVLVRRACLVG